MVGAVRKETSRTVDQSLKTIKMGKYYTSDEIHKQFDKLTKNQKINILYEAIDIMQSYNGRSRFYCIANAMGYENYEGQPNSYFKK